MPARADGITCAPPSRYTAAEREQFLVLVHMGGEANATPDRIRRAEALAMAWSGGDLIGIAALKRPLDSYREKVARRSGVSLRSSEWPYELGYVFVLPNHRGHGYAKRLVEHAVRAAGRRNVFATVRTNNEPMQATLRRFGFAQAGRDYLSDDAERTLSLWTRRA